jgi:hypothetical protein
MTDTQLAIFKGKKIRRYWDEKAEKWLFSIIDIIEVLTGSSIPRRYWSDLKRRLKQEGSQLYEKIVQLKMQALDGKYYLTDAADTESMFRIIQSIPSPRRAQRKSQRSKSPRPFMKTERLRGKAARWPVKRERK